MLSLLPVQFRQTRALSFPHSHGNHQLIRSSLDSRHILSDAPVLFPGTIIGIDLLHHFRQSLLLVRIFLPPGALILIQPLLNLFLGAAQLLHPGLTVLCLFGQLRLLLCQAVHLIGSLLPISIHLLQLFLAVLFVILILLLLRLPFQRLGCNLFVLGPLSLGFNGSCLLFAFFQAGHLLLLYGGEADHLQFLLVVHAILPVLEKSQRHNLQKAIQKLRHMAGRNIFKSRIRQVHFPVKTSLFIRQLHINFHSGLILFNGTLGEHDTVHEGITILLHILGCFFALYPYHIHFPLGMLGGTPLVDHGDEPMVKALVYGTHGLVDLSVRLQLYQHGSSLILFDCPPERLFVQLLTLRHQKRRLFIQLILGLRGKLLILLLDVFLPGGFRRPLLLLLFLVLFRPGSFL